MKLCRMHFSSSAKRRWKGPVWRRVSGPLRRLPCGHRATSPASRRRKAGVKFLGLLFAALFAVAPLTAWAQAPDSITVLAAASLSNVLPEIGKSYEAATHQRVAYSFAASMTLARQIEASAGADIFISADVQSMDYLQKRGLIDARSRRDLLANSLVLIAPADSKISLTIRPGFPLAAALNGGRLAMGEPASAPAGRYAQTALMRLKVWDRLSDHLAYGEDVRATLAYVARGEAPLGIVYATDARIEPRVRVVATFPAASHPPITYPAALVRDANPAAAAFLDYLKGPAARAIFAKAGFTPL
jgi:molybdate transport system substrate-binding protein